MAGQDSGTSLKELSATDCSAQADNPGRRRFFGSLAALAFFAGLPRLIWAQTDADLTRFAQRLMFSLVPNSQVPAALFSELAEQQIASASGRANLIAAYQRLEEISGSDWMILDAESRVFSLARVAEEPVFENLRRLVAAAVYNHPASFESIGYGGSSLDFGGYLNAGFNDISWLPEAPQ